MPSRESDLAHEQARYTHRLFQPPPTVLIEKSAAEALVDAVNERSEASDNVTFALAEKLATVGRRKRRRGLRFPWRWLVLLTLTVAVIVAAVVVDGSWPL